MVGETLEILVDKRLGDRSWITNKREEIQGQNEETCHLQFMQTRWQLASPCLEEQSQRLPMTWPKCLGRGIHLTVPPSLRSIDNPPSSAPFSSSSSDSSGSPSLESLMEPELGYEASLSSDADDKYIYINNNFWRSISCISLQPMLSFVYI